ncbi:hypothetical protein Aple_004570 [Acrocarpospora pleiomorpha]|uniref:DUF4158 domain-containing protein n=1 Tax=Acrocarpospora pleiomorpha TaxID=90975 RepID=A0A5M3XA00_9ACTN|nr:hypothetical protein Aple_004570 [Acrocarpospora pleiomorpha]
MATQVFADEELELLREFPEIGRDELARFFTLTPADVAFVDPAGPGPPVRPPVRPAVPAADALHGCGLRQLELPIAGIRADHRRGTSSRSPVPDATEQAGATALCAFATSLMVVRCRLQRTL